MKKHWGLNNASQRGIKWRRGWGRRGRLKMRKIKNPNELKKEEQKSKMASGIGKASRATSTLKYPSLPSSISSSSSSSLLFSVSSFQVYSWTKMTWRYRASETSSSTLCVIIAIEAFPLSSPCPRLSTQRCFFPLYAFFCIPPIFFFVTPIVCVCARARFFLVFSLVGLRRGWTSSVIMINNAWITHTSRVDYCLSWIYADIIIKSLSLFP